MTEIPEHLLKRAQAARDKAATETGSPDSAGAPPAIPLPSAVLSKNTKTKYNYL